MPFDYFRLIRINTNRWRNRIGTLHIDNWYLDISIWDSRLIYIYTKPISSYSITLSIRIPKMGSMIEKIDFFLSYYGIS